MGSERLALKNMGGETTEAWRAVLDDLAIAAYVVALPSSSWTVRRGWKRQSQRLGTACRFRGVRTTSTGTYSHTRPSACTTRSAPITTT